MLLTSCIHGIKSKKLKLYQAVNGTQNLPPTPAGLDRCF